MQLRNITGALKERYDIDDDEVVVVTGVDTNGEAYQKGIREGDVIKRVGTVRIKSIRDYNRQLEKASKRGSILLLVKNSGGSSRYYTLSMN